MCGKLGVISLIGTLALIGCGRPAALTPDLSTPDASTSDASTPELLKKFCNQESVTLPDADTTDLVYDGGTVIPCFQNPCLCGLKSSASSSAVEAIARCESVETGFYWGQGSVSLRIRERVVGKCRFDVYMETEGAGSVYSCEIPIPVKPWRGLLSAGDTTNGDDSFIAGIESYCQTQSQCSILPGAPQPCDASVAWCGGSASDCE